MGCWAGMRRRRVRWIEVVVDIHYPCSSFTLFICFEPFSFLLCRVLVHRSSVEHVVVRAAARVSSVTLRLGLHQLCVGTGPGSRLRISLR